MSDYSGRHRPPTRAERRRVERRSLLPKSLSSAYAVPTAAAVTLALTALGATAAQSSPFTGEAAEQASSALGAGSATALLEDPQLTKTVQTEVAVATEDTSELSDRRRAAADAVAESQFRAQERADRDKEREELAAKKEAEKKKAEEAKTDDAKTDDAKTDEAKTSASGWVRPLATGSMTSGFGFRWGRMHEGVDYGAPVGTPLRAMGDGTVIGAGPMGGYGVYIDVQYADGTVSRYGHLSAIAASVGQSVAAGDVVAYSGNTGRSTGPHLHLEIRPGDGAPVNPVGWLTEHGIL